MCRYFIIVFIFQLQLFQSYASDTGAASACVMQKKSKSTGEIKTLCGATLLDQTSILYNASCIKKQGPRATLNSSYQISCAQGLVIFPIPKQRKYARSANFKIHKISGALPFIPTQHYKSQNVENCYIQAIDKKIKINKDSISKDIKALNLRKELKSSAVLCENSLSSKAVLMGVISEDATFTQIKDLQSKYALQDEFKVELAAYEDDTVMALCNDTANCLSNLIAPAIELNEQLNDILAKLSTPEVSADRKKLADEFRVIERECHRKNIDDKTSYDNIEDAAITDKAMGVIEKSAIGLARAIEWMNPFDDEDFILSRFKETNAISENLSNQEIEEVFNKINKKDISNFEKIKELTQAYSTKVVNKLLDKMGTFDGLTQKAKQDFIRPQLIDLEKCLKSAVSSKQVKECSAYFTDKVAIAIGEKELERQIGLNFSADDDILSLSTRSTSSYMKCIENNIEQFEKIIDTTSVVKGCVYSGILSSYNQARYDRINNVVKGYTGKEDNTEYINQILNKANECQYAPVINKTKHSGRDFLALAQLETSKFTNEIGDCIESLKKNASYDVVELAIATNKKVQESLNEEEKSDLIKEIKGTHLPACLKARNTNDGNECSKFITAMATAKAARAILATEFNKQLDNVGLDDKSKDKIKKKVLQEYDRCIENAQNEFYKDLTKDPDENLINKCLTGAIKSLSDEVLEPTIKKSTQEKLIENKIIESALPKKELKKLRSNLSICLETNLGKHKELVSYQENLNAEIEECTFKTQRQVVKLIALETAKQQVADYNLTQEQTKTLNDFIKDHIESSTSETMENNVDILTPLLIQKVAPIAIEKTLSDFKHKLTEDEYNNAKTKISNELNSCLENALNKKQEDLSFIATQASQLCMSVTVKNAYRQLAPKIIKESIASLFPGEEDKVENLAESVSKELLECLENVKNDKEAQDNSSKCLAKNIGPIAKKIAGHVVRDLNRFANKDGSKTSFSSSQGHSEFLKCMDSPASMELSDVTKNMEKCVKNFTNAMKSEIKKRFVAVYGQSNPQELAKVIDTLLKTPGEPDETKFKDPNAKGMANDQLLTTLELVGETMQYSCRNNQAICSQHIHNTKIQMERHHRDNPKASTEENIDAFMESDTISNLIMSQIGINLNKTLKEQLKEYNDHENLVVSKVDESTNNSLLNEMLTTHEGKELKTYLMSKIDSGELDNLSEDKKLRKLLADMLTSDTSKGSFGDKLAEGLVQTQLNKLKRRSRGIKGFFKEFTVSAGDLFNIIDRKDFKWSKITATTTGKKARSYFIQSIIKPAIAGESTSKKEQERRVEEFKGLITKALKEANK